MTTEIAICKHCSQPIEADNYGYRPLYGSYHLTCEKERTMNGRDTCVNCGHKLGAHVPMDVIRRVRVLVGGLGAEKHYDVWLCNACVERVEALLGPPAEWVDMQDVTIHDTNVQAFTPEGVEMDVQKVYTRYGFGSVPPHIDVVVLPRQ
jgi:hypothetical protein